MLLWKRGLPLRAGDSSNMVCVASIAFIYKHQLACSLFIFGFNLIQGQVDPQLHCLWPTRSGPCESCELGWYGYRCQHNCVNCEIGGCGRLSGTCYQCSPGYYTTACTTTCPPHCRESYDGKVYCDRETGNCLENCKPSWWGDWCENYCSGGCVDNVCLFYDGSCMKGCLAGRSGESCDVQCPVNCKSADDGTEDCDGKTRRCPAGCKHGWWGELCEKTCSFGCIHKNCYHIDGICTDECQIGWTGGRCEMQCPSGCLHGTCTRYHNHECTQSCKSGFYGQHCNKICSEHCTDQECFFDHNLRSAVCKHGCIDGWYSHNCDRRCPHHCESCHRQTGQCYTVADKDTEIIEVKGISAMNSGHMLLCSLSCLTTFII